MDRKKTFNLEEIQNMDPNSVFDLIDGVLDDQAFDSDLGGDSDAEDNIKTNTSLPSTSRGKRSYDVVDNESDYDSDDSIADPNFDPNPKKNTKVMFSSSDEDDDEPLSNLFRPKPPSFNEPPKNPDFVWMKKPFLPHCFEAVSFIEPTGPKVILGDSPIEIFLMLFGDDLLDLIVSESNRYSLQKGTALDLTLEELKAFLGMLIIMGFHSLPSLRLYWSSDQNFHLPRISDTMTLKRFLKILRYIHLSDNEKMPQRGNDNFDKLYKVRPMINLLSNSFLGSYNPGRNLAVDESMIAFKGRSQLKQYMPQKPIKRGFKVWALACSETGYLLNFSVYEGKKESQEEGLLGEKTVLELTRPFEGKNYCVYFDNFFTSFPLLLKLLDRNIFGCGTVRTNRKNFPTELLVADKQLKAAESDSVGTTFLTVSKWKDRGKKSVVVATTIHSVSDMSTVKRMTKEGVRVTVNCPKSIDDYNQHMGGVDLFDQLHSCYNIAWKSRRWWLKFFYYFVDATIVNSYILYKSGFAQQQPNNKPKSHLIFRSILANQLIGDFSSRKKQGSWLVVGKNKMKKLDGRAVVVENTIRLMNVGDHLPTHTTSRRCARCSTEKKPKRSNVECTKCKVALCIPCFSLFHNR